MSYSGNQQEDRYCDTKRNFPEELGIRNELPGFEIESQEIRKDWISCVITEHDHEYALDKVQEAHE